jgi:chloride channel protein, CIC family
MVPIAVSVTVASTIRNVFAGHHWIRAVPLFPVPPHGSFSSLSVAEAAFAGLAAGGLAWVLTNAVYGAEDAFKRLPIHWMWWPAIGGLVVGVGGLIEPRALGVGYATIGSELAGRLAIGSLIAILLVKLVVWSTALGSGTSGGILAPLLMMGAALGGIMGHAFGGSPATWELMGMAGTLAGVTRSPFTSVVFAFELTHDTRSLLPLRITCALAHLTSALVLRRSILTEKVARRGFHVMREYAVDALEALFVREVMITDPYTVSADSGATSLRQLLEQDVIIRRQRLYPVVEETGALLGVIGWSDLMAEVPTDATVGKLMHTAVVVAHPDETLRLVADRMAEHHLGALPVVERRRPHEVVGMVTSFELLAGRRRQLEEERQRERTLRLRAPSYRRLRLPGTGSPRPDVP